MDAAEFGGDGRGMAAGAAAGVVERGNAERAAPAVTSNNTEFNKLSLYWAYISSYNYIPTTYDIKTKSYMARQLAFIVAKQIELGGAIIENIDPGDLDKLYTSDVAELQAGRIESLGQILQTLIPNLAVETEGADTPYNYNPAEATGKIKITYVKNEASPDDSRYDVRVITPYRRPFIIWTWLRRILEKSLEEGTIITQIGINKANEIVEEAVDSHIFPRGQINRIFGRDYFAEKDRIIRERAGVIESEVVPESATVVPTVGAPANPSLLVAAASAVASAAATLSTVKPNSGNMYILPASKFSLYMAYLHVDPKYRDLSLEEKLRIARQLAYLVAKKMYDTEIPAAGSEFNPDGLTPAEYKKRLYGESPDDPNIIEGRDEVLGRVLDRLVTLNLSSFREIAQLPDRERAWISVRNHKQSELLGSIELYYTTVGDTLSPVTSHYNVRVIQYKVGLQNIVDYRLTNIYGQGDAILRNMLSDGLTKGVFNESDIQRFAEQYRLIFRNKPTWGDYFDRFLDARPPVTDSTALVDAATAVSSAAETLVGMMPAIPPGPPGRTWAEYLSGVAASLQRARGLPAAPTADPKLLVDAATAVAGAAGALSSMVPIAPTPVAARSGGVMGVFRRPATVTTTDPSLLIDATTAVASAAGTLASLASAAPAPASVGNPALLVDAASAVASAASTLASLAPPAAVPRRFMDRVRGVFGARGPAPASAARRARSAPAASAEGLLVDGASAVAAAAGALVGIDVDAPAHVELPDWTPASIRDMDPALRERCKKMPIATDECMPYIIGEDLRATSAYIDSHPLPMEQYETNLTTLSPERMAAKYRDHDVQVRIGGETRSMRVVNPYRAKGYRARIPEGTSFAEPAGLTAEERPMYQANVDLLKAIAPESVIADKKFATAILESLWECSTSNDLGNNPKCLPAKMLGELRMYDLYSNEAAKAKLKKEALEHAKMDLVVDVLNKVRKGFVRAASADDAAPTPASVGTAGAGAGAPAGGGGGSTIPVPSSAADAGRPIHGESVLGRSAALEAAGAPGAGDDIVGPAAARLGLGMRARRIPRAPTGLGAAATAFLLPPPTIGMLRVGGP